MARYARIDRGPSRAFRTVPTTAPGAEATVDDWSPLDEFGSFLNRRERLQRDVLLTGTLHVEVRGPDGSPRAGRKVTIRGCGFV